jgi:PAS domain S-box-containing protein
MKREMLDPKTLRHLIYQALDDSDDLILVLERTDDGAIGVVVAACNDAFCRASGYNSDDLIGRPFSALAASDANPATRKAAIQSANDRQSFRTELLCNRPNGNSFWLGLHMMPAAEATPLFSVLLGRDITATVRDKQQRSAIQGLLAKVFASVNAAVAIVEEHGLIAMTNPALDRLLGYPPGALDGRASIEVTASAFRSTVLEARDRQVTNRQAYTIESAALHADGSEVRVELSSILVEREDLKRFRIITLTPLVPRTAPPPLTLHIAGKIKLIGLEDVKAALGSRWPAAAARAMKTAEHIVKQRCGPHDTWSRTDDSGFVIIFGDLVAAGSSLPVLVPVDFEVFLDRRCTERYIAAC